MRHISEWNRYIRTAALFGSLILAVRPSKAVQENKSDPFLGGWLLSVHSMSGPRVSGDEITVALKVSENGSFYNVQLEIPNIRASAETGYGGFSWAEFVKKSNKSLKNMTARAAKQNYTGEYLLDIGGKSITHQNGSVTFLYKPNTDMLCEKSLGCFVKGNQSELIKRYRDQQRDMAKAKVIAAAQARAEAKARAEAEAKRAEAEAERDRAFNGPFSEMTWEVANEYCRTNGGRLPSMYELNRTRGYGNSWFWTAERMSFKRGAIGTMSTNIKLHSYARCVQ